MPSGMCPVYDPTFSRQFLVPVPQFQVDLQLRSPNSQFSLKKLKSSPNRLKSSSFFISGYPNFSVPVSGCSSAPERRVGNPRGTYPPQKRCVPPPRIYPSMYFLGWVMGSNLSLVQYKNGWYPCQFSNEMTIPHTTEGLALSHK